LRSPKKGSFEHRLVAVDVDVGQLVRLSGFPATEPWWGRLKRYRFDCPNGSFGTLYAGDSLETAFAESVIHEDALFVDQSYVLEESDLTRRQVVLYTAVRPALHLADLTGAGLKALGLNNDISSGNDYKMTQRWAAAIHAASTKWDGIRYVSRQNNQQHAFAVFERSGLAKGSVRALNLTEQAALCDLFNINLV